MKFCNKCGNKLSDSMKFCNKCGASIELKDNNSSNKKDKDYIENTNTLNTSKNSITNDDILNEAKSNTEDTIILDKSETNKLIKNTKLNLTKTDTTQDDMFSDDTNNTSDSTNNIENSKPNKKKKKILLSIILIVVIIILGTAFYFLKSPLLFKYYYNSALKSSSITEKLSDYNNALKYGTNDEVLNSIYITLKSDSDFVDDLSLLTNLNKTEKNNLMSKLYVNKANEDFANKNYNDCLKDLDNASKYGYDKKSYDNYDDLMKKINDEKKDSNDSKVDNVYSFKNENPSKLSGNIYDYPYDYIMPYSDSTYLSTSDISQYNKSTLALIRNEIYARHGYVFNNDPFKSYFNSKSWYHPNPSFKGDDSELNEYEIKNVQTIKSIENSK